MKKEIIIAITAGITGIVAGYFIGKKCTEKKLETESDEPVAFNFYSDDSDEENLDEFDPEDAEGEIGIANEIAKENNYIPVVDDELNEFNQDDVDRAEEYNRYIEKHYGEIMVISPDYEKRSDSINNVLDLMDTESLLYFPDEGELWTESGSLCDIEEFTGNCMYKYGFASDPKQNELHVLNVTHERHYIIQKETEDTPKDLFKEVGKGK